MRRPRRRWPTIPDLMIIVAACALAAALLRAIPSEPWIDPTDTRGAQVCCLIFAASAAVWTMQLLPPRPRMRLLVRQPGFVAGTVALAIVLLDSGFNWHHTALEFFFGTDGIWGNWGPIWLLFWLHKVAPAVLSAWAVLWMGRGKRIPANGLEWAARVLGVYWVLVYIISRILTLIW